MDNSTARALQTLPVLQKRNPQKPKKITNQGEIVHSERKPEI